MTTIPRTCTCGALVDDPDDWDTAWLVCARCAARLMGEIRDERDEEWWA